MNILIFGPFSFPNGTGATARMHAYGRGLVALGSSVSLYCVKPTELVTSIQNTEINGEIDGIHFHYACGTTVAKRSYLARRIDIVKGLFRLFLGIIQENRQNKLDVVIYYTASNLIYSLVGWMACSLCRVPYYGETTEFPYVYEKQSMGKNIKMKLHQSVICRLFDGMIVISSLLEKYFRGTMRKSAQILRIPIIVDASILSKGKSTSAHRTICYCGNLRNLEEITSLMAIFSKIAPRYEDVTLKIIGDLENSPFKKNILDMVEDRNLKDRINFTGPVRHSDIPGEFASADVFVLPRPKGLFSSAGFPTKLGEYLATGKPVITTRTGDIPLYMTDKINAYLVEPENNEAFAEKISYILDNPEEALRVGTRGRETCIQYFDAKINAAKLLEHLQSL